MNYKKNITINTKDGITISFAHEGGNAVQLFIYDEEDKMIRDFYLSWEVLQDVGAEMCDYAEYVKEVLNG